MRLLRSDDGSVVDDLDRPVLTKVERELCGQSGDSLVAGQGWDLLADPFDEHRGSVCAIGRSRIEDLELAKVRAMSNNLRHHSIIAVLHRVPSHMLPLDAKGAKSPFPGGTVHSALLRPRGVLQAFPRAAEVAEDLSGVHVGHAVAVVLDSDRVEAARGSPDQSDLNVVRVGVEGVPD